MRSFLSLGVRLMADPKDPPPDGTVIGGDGEPIPPGDPDPYPSGG